MNFASDNITGAAPEILDAIQAGNDGALLPYGNDDVTRAVQHIREHADEYGVDP